MSITLKGRWKDCYSFIDKNFFLIQYFSAYQVIVLKVCDCYQELSRDFHLKLKDLNRNDTFYPFYVAAEIKNNPVHDKSWKFTVGDGKSYGAFVNKELTRGESYIVYQRALTNHNSVSIFYFLQNKISNPNVRLD